VVAKLDRLTPTVRDFGELVEQARARGWNLVCLDLGMDTSTAMGAAMAQMVSVFAELERKLIGERISAALREKRRTGARFGRKPVLSLEGSSASSVNATRAPPWPQSPMASMPMDPDRARREAVMALAGPGGPLARGGNVQSESAPLIVELPGRPVAAAAAKSA
jgi:hypothetical protein